MSPARPNVLGRAGDIHFSSKTIPKNTKSAFENQTRLPCMLQRGHNNRNQNNTTNNGKHNAYDR